MLNPGLDTAHQTDRPVVVVIGAGGMGRAIARRIGPGSTVVLAERSAAVLDAAATQLVDDGYTVETCPLDVGDPGSVRELAAAAAALGPVTRLAHTAGLSPVQASASAVLAVNLRGVGLVLEAFGDVIAPGGAGIVVSSTAGHMTSRMLSPQQEADLRATPPADVLTLPFADPETTTDPGVAYAVSKYANLLQVRAAAGRWGRAGARVNSISPGVISTPMGREELNGVNGARMRAMVGSSPAGRLGTPDDVAAAAAFLLGPEAGFITGADLLVDGGMIASMRSNGSIHG